MLISTGWRYNGPFQNKTLDKTTFIKPFIAANKINSISGVNLAACKSQTMMIHDIAMN